MSQTAEIDTDSLQVHAGRYIHPYQAHTIFDKAGRPTFNTSLLSAFLPSPQNQKVMTH